MKSIVILVATLCVYTWAIENQEDFDNNKEDCINILNLDPASIAKLDAVDLPPDDDEDFNKFVACDSKRKGLMTEIGEVLFDKIEKLLLNSNDVKELNKIQFYIYKSIISSAVNKCRSAATNLNSGKNMIHVHACIYKQLHYIKLYLENKF